MGGLGNQMFQVAATVGLSEKLNVQYSIPQWENSWIFIGDFNSDNTMMPRFHEPCFHYHSISQNNIELFGYFQSERYFKNCEGKIRAMFYPSNRIYEKIKWKYETLINKRNTCSIHVRRGDYLNLSEHHYNLEKEHYTSIIEMFPAFHYVCFSDDIAWCKENIPAQDFIHDSTAIDFHLMSMMKNHIIANSSFSWWASWLCTNNDKMIFAPPKNKWFGEKKKHLNVNDLYCDNWIYQR